jgi:hypothetical protein
MVEDVTRPLLEQAGGGLAGMSDEIREEDEPAVHEEHQAAARLYDQAAAELERAVAHCRWSARHFRGADVPRAATHAWAALGHIREAETRLDEQARVHRLKASV